MNKINFKNYLPQIIAIAVFLLVSIVYCLPLFQGMVVNQHDMLGVKGMTQQSIEFYQKYGRYPLWTNAMFSGMPTFQILFAGKYNVGIGFLHNIFTGFLPLPAGLFFLSCICFYILTQVLRLKTWVGIFGSLAYAFATYNAIIAQVGHITKFATMGYAPAVIAGLILLMQRKYILGFAFTLMFSTLFFMQNHVQMVYYFFIVIGCLCIGFLIKSIQQKDYTHLFKVVGLSVVAFAVAAACFAIILMPTNEYVKETMRGGRSELTLDTKKDKDNKSAGGLDKDYAFGWSYGKAESFTILLPNFMGSDGNPTRFGENSKVTEALQESRLPEQAVNAFYGSMSPYWGDQPGTSGPVYLGALVCLFFVAGLFFVPKKYLSWLIPATIIGLIFSWGNNFSAVNNFLFDHLPGLNKFRSVSSALVVPQLTFAIIASLALQQIFYGNIEPSEFNKKLKYAAISFGSILVLIIGFYFTSSFMNDRDTQNKKTITQEIMQMMSQGKAPSDEMSSQATSISATFSKALVSDRKDLYSSDLIRLLIYVGIAALLFWLYKRKIIKPDVALILLTIVSFIDLITVDSRYLNKTNYVTADDYVQSLTPSAADLQIKKDTSYFRVFDQSAGGDPFQDSRASYFHNSIGGYSPAKLALYEDIKIHQLQKGNAEVYNMLNTKYIIANDPAAKAIVAKQNPAANGAAWFVKNIKYVNNANDEMIALDSIHSKDIVFIDKREQAKVTTVPKYDSAAKISIVQNLNDEINYISNAQTPQFAVFSEIYYPSGWKAYIDNVETPIVKVDYAFRGLCIPAGHHFIKFIFQPKSYNTASIISLIGGLITIILLLGCIVLLYLQNKKQA